mmetsp:Transcript_96072/g.311721  ORF Transcript_96072/g.311721 Transcript_96072/m.311721 type:complete len:296 (-) Transcript_96072:206-1093(-)
MLEPEVSFTLADHLPLRRVTPWYCEVAEPSPLVRISKPLESVTNGASPPAMSGAALRPADGTDEAKLLAALSGAASPLPLAPSGPSAAMAVAGSDDDEAVAVTTFAESSCSRLFQNCSASSSVAASRSEEARAFFSLGSSSSRLFCSDGSASPAAPLSEDRALFSLCRSSSRLFCSDGSASPAAPLSEDRAFFSLCRSSSRLFCSDGSASPAAPLSEDRAFFSLCRSSSLPIFAFFLSFCSASFCSTFRKPFLKSWPRSTCLAPFALALPTVLLFLYFSYRSYAVEPTLFGFSCS